MRRPSADAVAGNGAPLSWRPSAVADAGNGLHPAPTQSRQRSPFTYMRQVLFTLANLRAVPAEGQDNADSAVLGLDQPVARVTLYTDHPEPVEMMRFGKHHAVQGAVYVRRDPPVRSTSCPVPSWTNCASRRCRRRR